MQNIYDNFKEDNKQGLNIHLQKLIDLGFNKTELKHMEKILDLGIRPIFKNNDEPIIFDNGEKSYSNGYSNGLYNGALKQAQYMSAEIIDRMIEDKFKGTDIDIEDINLIIRFLWVERKIYNILLDEYDISIVLQFEREYAEHEEEYYILIQKDDYDNEYDFTLIDYSDFYSPKIIYDYNPKDYELEEIKKYLDTLK